MPDLVIQRVVFPAEEALAELYYSHPDLAPTCDRPAELLGRRSVRIAGHATLSTDSYFNNFYECYWRRYTRLDQLVLQLTVSGEGVVQLCRRTVENGVVVLATIPFCGEEVELEIPAPAARFHFRELGALHFTLRASGESVILHAAEWTARGANAGTVNLVAGYCTYNREAYLLPSLQRLTDDAELAENLQAIMVVDQGTNKVVDHPAFALLAPEAVEKIRLVEQANLGGSGGFTRSILEAMQMPGASHVLLMDDDAVIEPESVFRTARFLALAKEDLAVGGSMLDLLQPRRLHEATAEFHPTLLKGLPILGGFPIGEPDQLKRLLQVRTTRYNGWWFMAFPLRLIEKVGLPLPFFIRGDDIEFGCRLTRAGIPIAALPGVAVWHEPFYLRAPGWLPYYEIRNFLVLCSLHFPGSRRQAPRAFLRRLLRPLMSHDYFDAWLLCEGVEDYCRGPAILDGDPQPIHQRLLRGARDRVGPRLPGAQHLTVLKPLKRPRSHGSPGFLLRLGICFLRQIVRASPPRDAQPDQVIQDRRGSWWTAAHTDVVAVQDFGVFDYRVLRRCRPTFVRTLIRGCLLAWRLWRRHPRLTRQWQEARERLTSKGFWNRYLGLSPSEEGKQKAAPPAKAA